MSLEAPLLDNAAPAGGGLSDKAQWNAAEIAKAEKTGPSGLSKSEADRRLAEYGPNMLSEVTDSECKKLAMKFWGPMPIMIWLAIIVEIAQSAYIDLAVL